jgi:hypothetical protein
MLLFRRRLSLEQLESRWCPSLTVSFFHGTLSVTGVPKSTLTIQETGAAVFQTMDGATTLHTFSGVANIHVRLSSRPADLNVLLDSSGLGGRLLIDLGRGFTGVSGTVHVGGGPIGGSVTITRGNGDETFDLGFDAAGAPAPLQVGGSVSVNAITSRGSDGASPRDTLFLQAGSSIGLDLTTTNVDSVFLASAFGALPNSSVGRNVSVSNPLERTTPDTFLLGTIGQDATITGPSTGVFDLVGDGFTPGSGAIGRNLTIHARGGDSIVGLSAGSAVGGNVFITTGGGNDFVELTGQVGGNASVSTGEGDDFFSLDSGAEVFGSLSVRSGNGTETVTVAGAVDGQLNVTVGNGGTMATASTITVTTAPGGLFTFRGGNGFDNLMLGDPAAAAPQTFDLDVLFGTGTNVLSDQSAASPNNDTLSGFVQGSGGNNTFTQGNADLVNIHLVDFP